jgi:hypothetical protein
MLKFEALYSYSEMKDFLLYQLLEIYFDANSCRET